MHGYRDVLLVLNAHNLVETQQPSLYHTVSSIHISRRVDQEIVTYSIAVITIQIHHTVFWNKYD